MHVKPCTRIFGTKKTVLQLDPDLSEEARQAMFDAFLRAADAVQAIVTDGAEAAMARFNGEGGKGA